MCEDHAAEDDFEIPNQQNWKLTCVVWQTCFLILHFCSNNPSHWYCEP